MDEWKKMISRQLNSQQSDEKGLHCAWWKTFLDAGMVLRHFNWGA